MAERPVGMADWVQSIAGVAFLAGLATIALPLTLPPGDATVAVVEIVVGLAVLGLGAAAAWQGRLHRPRRALPPALGLMVAAVLLATTVVYATVPLAHGAAAGVVGLVLFAAGAGDAWAAWRTAPRTATA